jgi:hypothetical protein
MHTKKPKPPLGNIIPLHAVCDEGYCIYCGEQNPPENMEPCRGPKPLREEIGRLRFLFRLALTGTCSKTRLLDLFGELSNEITAADVAFSQFAQQVETRHIVKSIEKKYGHCCGDVLNISAEDLVRELTAPAATEATSKEKQ